MEHVYGKENQEETGFDSVYVKLLNVLHYYL